MALAGAVMPSVTAGATVSTGGVNPYFGNLLSTTGQASMNVSVGTGLVYIPSSTAWNGMYAGYNTAALTVAIAASSSTQWRQDYIAAVVTDPGDNTANWNIVAVTGTFSSSSPGTLPALPNNAVPLAIVKVVPNMTVTNGGGTVVDARIWQPLAGTFVTTASGKPPTSRPEGTMWVETDTNLMGVLLNNQQQYFMTSTSVPDTWHTATMQNGWTGPVQYRLFPALNAVWVQGVIDPASESSTTFMTLPVGYRPASVQDCELGFHTSTGASSGDFLRAQTSGALQVFNVATGHGVIVVNNFISLDI